MTDDVRRAREILADPGVLALDLGVLEQSLKRSASVVDNDVDPAELAPDVVEPRGDAVTVANVETRGDDMDTERRALRPSLLQCLLVAIADRDVRSESRQRDSDTLADSGSRARDDA